MFVCWSSASAIAWLWLLLVGGVACKDKFEDLNEQYGGALTDSGVYLYGSNKWGDDGSGSQNMTVC
jgi:hypothetical protein